MHTDMAWTKLRLVLFWIKFARAKRHERLEREISRQSPLDFDLRNKRAKVDERHFRFSVKAITPFPSVHTIIGT